MYLIEFRLYFHKSNLPEYRRPAGHCHRMADPQVPSYLRSIEEGLASSLTLTSTSAFEKALHTVNFATHHPPLPYFFLVFFQYLNLQCIRFAGRMRQQIVYELIST